LGNVATGASSSLVADFRLAFGFFAALAFGFGVLSSSFGKGVETPVGRTGSDVNVWPGAVVIRNAPQRPTNQERFSDMIGKTAEESLLPFTPLDQLNLVPFRRVDERDGIAAFGPVRAIG
jgi:hypothetical protein